VGPDKDSVTASRLMASWASPRSLCATLVVFVGAVAAPPAAWSTFPGLNGQLVYEARNGALTHIFTLQPVPGNPGQGTQLTFDGAIDRDAAWSPNGRQIAFMSQRDGNAEIYLKNSEPSAPPRRLTTDPASDVDPTFSPDGTQLAFTSTRDGNREIYVMAIDGSAPRRLTFDPAIDQQADWSPDGQRIAFESNRDGDMDIYTMTPDGGAVTRLTSNPEFDADPSWHPDGTRIAYVSGAGGAAGGRRDIFTLTPGTAAPTNLTFGPYLGDHHFPAWSPDGEQIAFTRGENNTSVIKAGADLVGVAVADGVDAAWGPLPQPTRAPEPSKTVNLRPLDPQEPVFVRVEGAEAAAPLVDAREIPVGSPKGEYGTVIDTRHGGVLIEAATPNERSTSSAAVSEGRATLSQTHRGDTVLRLPQHPCPRAGGVRLNRLRVDTTPEDVAIVSARAARHRRGHRVRSPRHGDASGTGTHWTTTRTCRKTTVRVHSGVVEVTDFVKDETVRLEGCERRDRGCRRRDKYVIHARR
jgi:dipeptidyl aminopeptidase/acylaminoacyl peptidase